MITDILQYTFLQHALLAGLLASVSCGIIGTYIIVKRISFISGSIAHSAFGGIGLGFYLGFNPLYGAIGFGIGASLLMSLIRRVFKQQEDTLIGTLWALGMALGIWFIHLSQGYATDLFGYLFGNILFTSTDDLLLILVLNIIIFVIVGLCYRSFQAITYDEDYAAMINLPVTFLYSLMLLLISITTVILIKVVGIILVIALLTMPAASALNLSYDLKIIKCLAILFGMIATTGGIMLSYYTDGPTSTFIILVCAAIYGLSLIYKAIAQR